MEIPGFDVTIGLTHFIVLFIEILTFGIFTIPNIWYLIAFLYLLRSTLFKGLKITGKMNDFDKN